MSRYSGKTVLITGAASGIGQAAAKRFADEGADLVLFDMDEDSLRQVASRHEGARMVVGDVSLEGDCARLIDETDQIDVLIANAGIAVTGTMSSVSPEDFDAQIKTNLYGVYFTMKCAWDKLSASGGCVIATSSVSGMRGDFNAFAYNTSKGGISNMIRAAALDFQNHGIRVNAVAPGFTRTGLTDEMEDDDEFMDSMLSRISMGRAADPSEIASVMAFLASDDASFVNGVILPIDGGLTASNGQPPLG